MSTVPTSPHSLGRSTDRDLTRVLSRWQDGDEAAAARLLPLVYGELRRLARGQLRKERADHTLQPTALVHEAYLRLAEPVGAPWSDRAHFYAVASRVMRQILVDHARRHAAAKRGGDAVRLALDEVAEPAAASRATSLLALDDALSRLRTLDRRQAAVIELRYFGGLTLEQCAELLDVSTATVVNDARRARAWLFTELGPAEAGGESDGR